MVEESQANEELLKVYKKIKNRRGKLSNIMMVQSLNPPAMQAHLDLYLSLMFGASGIKRDVREMIAIVVSKANGCDYCIQHHAEALNYYWRDSNRLKNFLKNFKTQIFFSFSKSQKVFLLHAMCILV